MSKKVLNKRKVLFRKGKIQGLNRVALPIELLANLNLKEGDAIDLYLDVDNESIILKKGVKNG